MSISGTKPYERWMEANVVRGAAKGTVSAMAYARLGDITTDQFRALASITRELAHGNHLRLGVIGAGCRNCRGTVRERLRSTP